MNKPHSEPASVKRTEGAPSFKGRRAASPHASRAAAGASRKSGTSCETKLARLLWHAGARYRKNVRDLPGKPDFVFLGPRVVVFCDGDFWHGKGWEQRRPRLSRGNNASYWIAKIERNMARDREHDAALRDRGWSVLRFWESEIQSNGQAVVEAILAELDKQRVNGVKKA